MWGCGWVLGKVARVRLEGGLNGIIENLQKKMLISPFTIGILTWVLHCSYNMLESPSL